MKETSNKDIHDISIDTNNDNDEHSNKRKEVYDKCETCKRYSWCQSHDPQLLTKGWTSGNEILDDIIKSTQLEATKYHNNSYLQWIPFDELKDIEKTGKG